MISGWIVGSNAVFTQLLNENVAPGIAGPVGSVVECFSTRASPPTRENAGPALRLLAGDAEGLAAVFATLAIAAPLCAVGGSRAGHITAQTQVVGTTDTE